MKYGYIGLGNLGKHLAASLRRAGFTVVVNDLNRETAQPLLDAMSVGRFAARTGRAGGLRYHLSAVTERIECRVDR